MWCCSDLAAAIIQLLQPISLDFNEKPTSTKNSQFKDKAASPGQFPFAKAPHTLIMYKKDPPEGKS